ncbi:MAG: tRNA (adenosine(37)-N6)-threonylcarbamoyltransferase complex dimerization subunit type 1 TsaB [Dehalococcoidia bacterium]|nr:tRNA (adenosine(37)-N6)-threonylcarbamoyltransferase complex dimerization subunit type 1 TsaB [Dehalococcoidia bacterium]
MRLSRRTAWKSTSPQTKTKCTLREADGRVTSRSPPTARATKRCSPQLRPPSRCRSSSVELSIDTSTRYASIALSERGALISGETWHSQQNHTVELAPAVDRLLKKVDATPSSLTAVFIALGPGGFSALRVGLGFAKGMAEGLHVPLVGICTLEIEAHPYLATGQPAYTTPVYAIIEAGRSQIAWAGYRGTRCIAEPQVTTPEELAAAAGHPAVFCGEGLASCVSILKTTLPNDTFHEAAPPTRNAATLAVLAWQRFERGGIDDPAILQPLYLRRPSISLPKTPKA